jgi:hypothetical protein
MHTMTTGNRQYTLRVDLTSFEGGSLYAEYTDFYLASATDFYRLYVSGYSGTAGKSQSSAFFILKSTKSISEHWCILAVKWSTVNILSHNFA